MAPLPRPVEEEFNFEVDASSFRFGWGIAFYFINFATSGREIPQSLLLPYGVPSIQKGRIKEVNYQHMLTRRLKTGDGTGDI